MRITYKINSDELRIDRLREVFLILERTFKYLNINFYLIGAIARDILATANKISLPRATGDIDVAVMVADNDKYQEIIKHLVEKEGFKASESKPIRLFWGDTTLDLIPFGEIETEGSKVSIHGKEALDISVLGMKEVYDASESVSMDNDLLFKVTSFPGICVLKLVAYSENPEHRIRDIDDIDFIIKNFAEIYQDDIINNHHDLMRNNWDENLSARVLGRYIASILETNTELSKRVIGILESNCNSDSSKIAETMVAGKDITLESKVKVLQNLLDGIKERL